MDDDEARQIAAAIAAAWERVDALGHVPSDEPFHSIALALFDLNARLEMLEEVERDRQTQIAEDSWYDRGSEDS
jgi:hypothetical protein